MLLSYQDPIVKLVGDWAYDINVWSVILRVVLACLIGGIIGAERASKHHVAGLRTYILVCLGSCAAMMTNQFISDSADVARLGAGVVTGIGFLGAGTIMVTSRNQVRGLTTAAALWACGCVGLAIGIGFYTMAIAAAIVILLALVLLPKIEQSLQDRAKLVDIHIELLSIAYDPAYANTGLSVYSIALKINKNEQGKYIKHDLLLKNLKALEYVNYVEYMD